MLTHRLRPLVWRALARRTFLLTYAPPTDPGSNLAPTLSLAHLATTAAYLQRRLEGWQPAGPSAPPPGSLLRDPRRPPQGVTPTFLRAVNNSTAALASSEQGAAEPSTLAPPPGGPRKLRPNEGLLAGNLAIGPDDVEMVVAALVQQGLMRGYVAHASGRFAIVGAKQAGGPVAAGWPAAWAAIAARMLDEGVRPDEVPGWVRA